MITVQPSGIYLGLYITVKYKNFNNVINKSYIFLSLRTIYQVLKYLI
jgi:hypothetical protein